MSDLISREALTEYFEKHKRIAVHKDDIVAAICNAQAIDAVPLKAYKALEAENEALKNALKSAIYDIAHECDTCRFMFVGYYDEAPCSRCRGADKWAWRGVSNGT